MNNLFLKKIFFPLLFISQFGYSQSGGPPMLTDDPGIVDQGHFEINTSINSEVNSSLHLDAPLLDINYGFNNSIQLKFEMPYELSGETGSDLKGTAGKPNAGIKIRFIDGDSNSVSVSCYPQYAFAVHKNENSDYKLPIQFEKPFGKLVAGDEISYLNEEQEGYIFNGILAGIKFTQKFEMMGELYFILTAAHIQLSDTKLNFGMRYGLSRKINVLCSFGTDVQNREKEERNKFFSYTGVQWLL